MVIGREDADITIHDSEVSRRHAEVRLAGAGLEIEDLGSTNGTFVNGERIQGERALGPGDVIRVGNTELALDGPPAAAAPAAGAGGTAVSKSPDSSAPGPEDTAVEPPAAGPGGPPTGPAGAPVEPPSPVPSGIEPGTAAITPPQGGAYVPPQTDPYTPPHAGAAYTPPAGQGGLPPQGGPSGPPTGGGPAQGYGGPPPGSPPWGSGGPGGPGPGPGGYGGPPGTGGKSKAPLIIGLVAGALVIAALLVLFVWKPFAPSDEEKVREVVAEFGASVADPSVCQLVTQDYLEEFFGETGEAAIDACEGDLADEPVDIEITSVEIDGERATVEVEAEGESTTLELEKQEDGEWLIDGIG